MDEADRTTGPAGVAASGITPLLRTLGDADAAVCTDGFCAVPPAPAVHAGPDHAGPVQVNTGQVNTGQVNTGQVNTTQASTAQAGASE
jgi:hypothetical protein